MNYFDRAKREIIRRRELEHERMALRAGIIFLIGWTAMVLTIMVPAVVNEAPHRHPDMWRYLHQTDRLPERP